MDDTNEDTNDDATVPVAVHVVVPVAIVALLKWFVNIQLVVEIDTLTITKSANVIFTAALFCFNSNHNVDTTEGGGVIILISLKLLFFVAIVVVLAAI